ncbi:hypothetical protein RFI_26681 [Reticulomyxa filosa]|uniref:Uncharacterized protein n=1 Tax=Reticulomyxa filosa TaxID=46433 RepID=X6MAK0_RETFI|nr:hypothetical protein RFI_26681 [Reticulomyxa filosa]|eukprot:ETO10696.1 hypothetical protein RFI_26681 [Reticulomyxa filosa]
MIGNEQKTWTQVYSCGEATLHRMIKSQTKRTVGWCEINIAQHEEDSTVYPFKSVMCVFTNMKYDNALMIFFNNGKEPLHFFCDSEQDRDSLHQLLASIPAGKFKEVAIGVGAKAELETECFKKGKLKWASRQMVVVKNRILIFRSNDKSQFPLNMISLLEPNIFVSLSDQYEKAIQVFHSIFFFYLREKKINK